MQFFRYLLYLSQLYMFRMLRPSILRSTVMYRREGTVYVCMWCVVRVEFQLSRVNLYFFTVHVNPYPTAFPYGNGMVLHFYQQQESSTTKTVHKVITKRLKTYV